MTDIPFNLTTPKSPLFDTNPTLPSLSDRFNLEDTQFLISDKFDDEVSLEDRKIRMAEAQKLTDLICTKHGQDIFLVVGQLMYLSHFKETTFAKATASTAKLIQAINHIYDPDFETVPPQDAAIINSLFPQMNGAAKKDPDALEDEEQALLNIQKKTTFFSRCFIKECPLLTDLMLRFWGKYDGNFIDFLKADDTFVNKNIQNETGENTSCKGLDHILNNPFFATRTAEHIPVDRWNNHITISLFICALESHSPTRLLDTFIQKLESDPNKDRLQKRCKSLLGMLKDNYAEHDDILNTTESMPHFVRLLNTAKSPQLCSELSRFLVTIPDDFLRKVTQSLKTDTDYKSFIRLYAQNTSGPAELLSFKKENGQNVIWDLYDKSLLPPALMEKFIQTAIRNDRLDFLMLPKKGHLTPAFPGYQDLCHYFTDMPHQALHFIASFHQNDMAEEKRGDLIQDFIPSPAVRKPLFCRYNMLHHWIKKQSHTRITDFFFGIDTEPVQPVEPTMAQTELDLFWSRKDTSGKTPWHYLCESKEKYFFKRHFKPLHASFLKVCQIPDSSGRTPLDYASDSLKFMQYLAEKIPGVAKAFSQKNYSLAYQPAVKQKLEEPTPPSTPTATITVPTKETEKWTIVFYGSDSELKNERYKSLIEGEVHALPSPKSSAMRERMNRDKKAETYNTSAFKTHWHNVRWRVPYIVHDSTIYILPGCARKEAYKKPHCQLIRTLATRLEKELSTPTLVAHHTDPTPTPDTQNQKK